jgi:hypothetical protein
MSDAQDALDYQRSIASYSPQALEAANRRERQSDIGSNFRSDLLGLRNDHTNGLIEEQISVMEFDFMS